MRDLRLRLVALGEWVLVGPTTLLLAALALRLLQPRQYEPARTLWTITGWVGDHLSHAGAAAVFLALPSAVVLIGPTTLFRVWREDASMRQDLIAALMIFRRRVAVGLIAAATVVGSAILMLVLVHAVAD